MSCRILIVEDEAGIRAIWRKIFEKLGHQCTTVDGAAQAIQELKRAPFDLLITDLRMPGMTGLQLLEAIHEDALLGGLSIYVCSAFIPSDDSLDKFGVRRVIEKPFVVASELEYFREALRGCGGTTGVEPPAGKQDRGRSAQP